MQSGMGEGTDQSVRAEGSLERCINNLVALISFTGRRVGSVLCNGMRPPHPPHSFLLLSNLVLAFISFEPIFPSFHGPKWYDNKDMLSYQQRSPSILLRYLLRRVTLLAHATASRRSLSIRLGST